MCSIKTNFSHILDFGFVTEIQRINQKWRVRKRLCRKSPWSVCSVNSCWMIQTSRHLLDLQKMLYVTNIVQSLNHFYFFDWQNFMFYFRELFEVLCNSLCNDTKSKLQKLCSVKISPVQYQGGPMWWTSVQSDLEVNKVKLNSYFTVIHHHKTLV